MVVQGNIGEFDENTVRLMTMHAIKGLEFNVVFIIGLNDQIIPFVSQNSFESNEIQESMDRKLLYVGMTRSNELLYLSSSARPSKFISDIKNEYLRINRHSDILPYFNIPIEEYHFEDKIDNIYSNEERVRQWFINQLIKTYNYPISQIQIEYKVKVFSKAGYVDIAVFADNNSADNSFVYDSSTDNSPANPFMFIEVKAYGSGINDALTQLKSYMCVNKNCEYGAASDGDEITIIDKYFNVIKDIPKYSGSNAINSDLKEYEYINLTNNRKNVIIVDSTKETSVGLQTQFGRKTLSADEITSIPVYTNIAAGKPIYIDERIEDKFSIPKELIGNRENCFILKIKGESMINAGINNGDHVVIRKQSSANVGDIIAADVGGEATLKRFNRMGDQILLLPENNAYEPILLKQSQVRVIGVAVGVLKGLGKNYLRCQAP